MLEQLIKFANGAAQWMTTIFLAMLIGFQVHTMILQHTSPYILQEIRLAPDQRIRENEKMIIHYDLTKLRVCRLDLSRFLMDDHTGVIVWRDRVPGVSSQPGRVAVDSPFQLPPTALSGRDYTLSIELISQCTEGVHVDPWQKLHFHVE